MAVSKSKADALLQEMFVQYYPSVYRYCLVRTKHARGSEEDSAQETFIVLYKRLLSGEQIENPKAFLFRTCENMCKKADTLFLRRAKRSVDWEDMSELPAPETDYFAIDLDYDRLKEELLTSLDEEEQQLFQWKYAQKKSLNEIGKLLGISANAVALRLFRVREKIKTLVEPTIETYRKGGYNAHSSQ